MSFTRPTSWRHALFFLLIATTQARVALFELFERGPKDVVVPGPANNKRQLQCTIDIYYSILSLNPSGAQFCYSFDPSNYDTTFSTVSATTT